MATKKIKKEVLPKATYKIKKDVAPKATMKIKNDIEAPIEHVYFTKPREKTWKQVFYDKETGEVLNRTGWKWARLGLFYLVFYTALALLFYVCMLGLCSTLTTDHPKWQLEESRIGTNPGLTIRPNAANDENNPDVTIISFTPSQPASYENLINLLNNFLEPYKNVTALNSVKCDKDNPEIPRYHVCQINLSDFGPCSPHNKYGYKSSSPCIFLKLNRVFNWIPNCYNSPKVLPTDMPEDLQDYIKYLPHKHRDQVWVSCKFLNADKKEVDDGIAYYPGRGFPKSFYPFRNTEGYLNPLVAVQFQNVSIPSFLDVECRVWAKNIEYQKGKHRLGSVVFKLWINN